MTYGIAEVSQKVELSDRSKEYIESLREQVATARELGLKEQASLLEKEIIAAQRSGVLTLPPLTEDEYIIWQAWLPTVYADTVKEGPQLSQYSFDLIPGPVLDKWREWSEAGYFERFEIWTSKTNCRPDRVLMGVNGTNFHLLARWNEPSAPFVSFKEIKKRLKRERLTDPIPNTTPVAPPSPPYLLGGIIAILLFFGGVIFMGGILHTPLLPLVVVSVIVGAGVGVCFRYWERKEFFKKDPILKAIAAHDARAASASS